MKTYGQKWGTMTMAQRQRHQRLVGYILKELKNGKTPEEVALENGYTLESVQAIVKHYNLDWAATNA